MPAQPVRDPEQGSAGSPPAVTEPAQTAATTGAGQEAADPAPSELAPASKRAPARKAAPAKKAAPVKQVAPAKKAAAKRSPAKKTTPAIPPPAPEAPATRAGTSDQPPALEPRPRRLAAVATEPAPGSRAETPVPRSRFPTSAPSLTERLLADPARSPGILAEAAVQTFGPRARAWAADARATYPTASDGALARLAVRQFVRAAGWRGGLGALAGPYASIALATATVITHAELVLHLAAIHGLDPADPERAGDLLKLASPGLGPAGVWVAVSLVGRRLPGVGLLTAFLGARATTELIAVRARRFYAEYSSQLSQEPGSSS